MEVEKVSRKGIGAGRVQRGVMGLSIVKISVIVPVYNTGPMLERCIKSLLKQSMKEIEIILVDDGSNDDSPKICDRFAEKDKRVKVIHKKNEGVSIARNTGISAAKGAYIGFVDSDDWIDDNMYINLYSKAMETEADIVMCDATTVYDDGKTEQDTITQIKNSTMISKIDITPELLLELAGAAWRCVYRTELIKSNSIEFPDGIKLAEDRIFNILAIGNMKKLAYIKRSYYNRYIRKGSAVNKYYPDMLEVVLQARSGVMNALDAAWKGNIEYKTEYEKQTVAHALAAINNEFYKDAEGSFVHRYKKIKKLCSTPEIRNAIDILNRNDIRSKMIIKKMVFPLCMIAILLNKKYGR